MHALKSRLFCNNFVFKDFLLRSTAAPSSESADDEGTGNKTKERRTSRDIVMELPEFQQELKDREVLAGDTARFDVKVTGKPEPEVKWLKNGNTIEKDSRVKFVDESDVGLHSLLITGTRVKDEGLYRVTASSAAGSVFCEAQLFVEGKNFKL